MNRKVKELISVWLPKMQEPILEIGSKIVNPNMKTNREEFFSDKAYTGVDLEEGRGVDMVADATKRLMFVDGMFKTILCFDTLEHVDKPWLMMQEVNRLAAPNALIVMSAAFMFDVHNCPADYWRFTTEGLKVLLEGWEVLDSGYITQSRLQNLLYKFGIEISSPYFARESYIIGRKR